MQRNDDGKANAGLRSCNHAIPTGFGTAVGEIRNAGLVLLLLLSAGAHAADSGTVCIARVPVATSGEKTLANYTASDSPFDFSLRIGERAAVKASHSDVVRIEPLPISRQMVAIRRNGKPFASFPLHLADEPGNAVCLEFGPFYETWSVKEAAPAKKNCGCSDY